MSENAEAGSGADSSAVALALTGASREEADAFLRDQRSHVHEQLKQIHLDIFEKWLGVALRLATLVVGLAAATGAGLMAWDAAHSKGLLIEPFSVPPDMAAKGLTSQAVASLMLDKLTAMQNRTQSARSPQSYTNNWGEDLKVEIPETGVSIGEFRRVMRDWLGHDTRISGGIWRTPAGIAITARTSGAEGEIVSGSETDFDTLMQQVAENVYRVTQPYRYANYLDRIDYRPGEAPRLAEAEAIYRQLIYDPSPEERKWAWNGLGTLARIRQGSIAESVRDYRKALEIDPDFETALSASAIWLGNMGHAEEALQAARRLAAAFPQDHEDQRVNAEYLGDYAEAARICLGQADAPDRRTPFGRDFYQGCSMWNLAFQHDGEGARAWLRELGPLRGTLAISRTIRTLAALRDWPAVVKPLANEWTRAAVTSYRDLFDRQLRPLMALAKAHLGDMPGAEALIAPAPDDCYVCTYTRGSIAAMAGDPGRADYWFDRAVGQAPSIPFAYCEWGEALLQRGQPDAAIAKFKLANQKGPHFADPLEMWGEALMAKNQSHLALVKFAEAEKFAPNWGRLHLKWGEALVYAGRPDDAKIQFARAAQLDLTPSEKTELSKVHA